MGMSSYSALSAQIYSHLLSFRVLNSVRYCALKTMMHLAWPFLSFIYFLTAAIPLLEGSWAPVICRSKEQFPNTGSHMGAKHASASWSLLLIRSLLRRSHRSLLTSLTEHFRPTLCSPTRALRLRNGSPFSMPSRAICGPARLILRISFPINSLHAHGATLREGLASFCFT